MSLYRIIFPPPFSWLEANLCKCIGNIFFSPLNLYKPLPRNHASLHFARIRDKRAVNTEREFAKRMTPQTKRNEIKEFAWMHRKKQKIQYAVFGSGFIVAFPLMDLCCSCIAIARMQNQNWNNAVSIYPVFFFCSSMVSDYKLQFFWTI